MAGVDYDVGIVGGGISGLLFAHRLLKAQPQARVVLWEALDAMGGRVITEHHLGFCMEYGPMRYEPDLQPMFQELLKELSIATKVFAPYSCPHAKPDLNELQAEEIQAIFSSEGLSPAFALLKYGLKEVLGKQWDLDRDDFHDPKRRARKAWLKKNGTFQGRPLFQHGLWDTLAHVLSKEALDFLIAKATFYHMIHTNPNAADQVCFMLDILATLKFKLITIRDGSDSLVHALHERVKGKITMHLKHPVKEFETLDGGVRVVITGPQGEHEARVSHLIMTCQQKALSKIEGFQPKIRSLLRSVFLVKLFKIFIVLEDPPFDETSVPEPNFGASFLPCREVHYQYDKSTGRGLVMIYGDVPSLAYWTSFVDQKGGEDGCSFSTRPQRDCNPHLKNHAVQYLQRIFPDAQFTVLHYGILDWSAEPHNSGIHLWKPGYESERVMKQLRSFGDEGRAHICGETYSNYQGFIEGCILSVDGVLQDILARGEGERTLEPLTP